MSPVASHVWRRPHGRQHLIKNVSVPEREEIIIDFARRLETASREALVYGEGRFAVVSANMAEAIRVNADELARE
ncbi:urease accessory protein UreE [Rhizobium leguminosarum]